jgi:hypothetical protein
VEEGMRCEKQDVPRATLTGFRNLAVITMRRLEKMILRKEEELHQKVPNDLLLTIFQTLKILLLS